MNHKDTGSSETSVRIYQTSWRHDTEDRNALRLRNWRCDMAAGKLQNMYLL